MCGQMEISEVEFYCGMLNIIVMLLSWFLGFEFVRLFLLCILNSCHI